VIAEVFSLSGYESQVAALLDEEERMVMEFFITEAAQYSWLRFTRNQEKRIFQWPIRMC
jgi:hypothetical protein